MENEAFWQALDKLIGGASVVIDRPKGSGHPRYPDYVYPLDYGYLEGTASMDGEGIDVWLGTGSCGLDAVLCTVDLVKRDSQIKLLLNCTEQEKALIYRTHNETDDMKAVMLRRPASV